MAPALGEEAALGAYVESSVRTAWSVEVVEAGNLALDDSTPQFGFIGFGGRHLARPDQAIDFQRLAVGIAATYNGRQLASGIGAEVTVAYLLRGSHGVSVHLGGYFFDADEVTKDTLLSISIGYVFSPVRYRPAQSGSIPQRDEGSACGYLSAYRDALARARKLEASACADEHAPACDKLRGHVRLLEDNLNKCMLGNEMGPPQVPDDP